MGCIWKACTQTFDAEYIYLPYSKNRCSMYLVLQNSKYTYTISTHTVISTPFSINCEYKIVDWSGLSTPAIYSTARRRDDWRVVVRQPMLAANADDGRPRRTTRWCSTEEEHKDQWLIHKVRIVQFNKKIDRSVLR